MCRQKKVFEIYLKVISETENKALRKVRFTGCIRRNKAGQDNSTSEIVCKDLHEVGIDRVGHDSLQFEGEWTTKYGQQSVLELRVVRKIVMGI